MGIHGNESLHRWAGAGGNNAANTKSSDALVLSKSVLTASTISGTYKSPRNESYRCRRISPSLNDICLPFCNKYRTIKLG